MRAKEIQRSFSLLLAGFIIFSSLYVTQPIFKGLSHYFNVSITNVSLTLSISTLMLAIGLFIVPFFNRIERKRLISISAISVSILSLLSIFTTNFTLFLILRGLLGLALSGVPSTAMAYISDEVSFNRVNKVMGLYVAGTTIGGMSGRIVVGILSDFTNWQIAIGSISVLNLMLSILMVILLPKSKVITTENIPTKVHLAKYKNLLRNIDIIRIMLLAFILMGSFVTIYSYITVRFEMKPFSLSESFIAFIFLLYLLGSYSSVYFGSLSTKITMQRSYVIALTIMICGIVLTFFTNLIVNIFGLAFITFGFFGAHSIQSSYIATLTNSSSKSHASTLYLLGYYIGSSLLTIIGGVIFSYFHWIGIAILTLVLTLFASILSYRLFNKQNYSKT